MEPESIPVALTKNNLATPIAIVIAGVIIAGALVIGLRSSGSSSAAATDPSAQQPAQAVDISQVKTAGEPFIGQANAPVTIAYWYDYQCPFCKQNEETAMPQIITDYVDTGKVKIVFKDFQFLGPDSQTLGQFSRAVWAAAPDKFYLWHKAVYDNAGTENTGWATHAKIMSITTSVLGAAEANAVNQLVITNSATYQKEMDADKAEGTAFGISGTPGFIIGKQLIEGAQPYAAIKQVIDLTLAGK